MSTAEDGVRSLRVLIGGRVQGVGYRNWLAGEARRAGLDGWVRNLADGHVEAVLRGPAETVRRVIEACRTGPSLASVSSVEQRAATAEEAGTLRGFAQR